MLQGETKVMKCFGEKLLPWIGKSVQASQVWLELDGEMGPAGAACDSGVHPSAPSEPPWCCWR